MLSVDQLALNDLACYHKLTVNFLIDRHMQAQRCSKRLPVRCRDRPKLTNDIDGLRCSRRCEF